jgi:hypothetical protein
MIILIIIIVKTLIHHLLSIRLAGFRCRQLEPLPRMKAPSPDRWTAPEKR